MSQHPQHQTPGAGGGGEGQPASLPLPGSHPLFLFLKSLPLGPSVCSLDSENRQVGSGGGGWAEYDRGVCQTLMALSSLPIGAHPSWTAEKVLWDPQRGEG